MTENNKYKSIFSGGNQGCLSKKLLLGYLDGRLSENERLKVERHLVDCPFCSDALEGLELLAENSNAAPALSAIERDIDIITHDQDKIKQLIPAWYKIAVAASLILLVGVSFFTTRQLMVNRDNTMAQKEKVQPEVDKAINKEEDFESAPIQEKPEDTEEAIVKATDEEAAIIINKKIAPESADGDIAEITTMKEEKLIQEPEVEVEIAESPQDAFYSNQPAAGKESPAFDMAMDEVAVESEVMNKAKPRAAQKTATATSPAQQESLAMISMELDTVSVYQNAIAQIKLGTEQGYREAVKLLNGFLKKETGNLAAYYHLGLSYFHLNEYDNALSPLEVVILDGTSELTADAVYYKAVILMEKGNNDEAMLLLERIKNIPSPQEPTAGRLLRELRKK